MKVSVPPRSGIDQDQKRCAVKTKITHIVPTACMTVIQYTQPVPCCLIAVRSAR